jgi:hypothetical protein
LTCSPCFYVDGRDSSFEVATIEFSSVQMSV